MLLLEGIASYVRFPKKVKNSRQKWGSFNGVECFVIALDVHSDERNAAVIRDDKESVKTSAPEFVRRRRSHPRK
ncbi:unnamed protein product [Gordionus sp. m RMFG-2023]